MCRAGDVACGWRGVATIGHSTEGERVIPKEIKLKLNKKNWATHSHDRAANMQLGYND